MVRDRENTFCTSAAYKSANQSQDTTLFSQPIRSEYTVFHNAEWLGGHILHIEQLQVSHPITSHYFIQPTKYNRIYSSPPWWAIGRTHSAHLTPTGQPTDHKPLFYSVNQSELSIQFSIMLSDWEDTFCTPDTYRSANQSQATILFS